MGPRRSHTKSRNGCQPCKTRKVKCDETRPHCNNCLKHGVQCLFGEGVRAPRPSVCLGTSSAPSPAPSGENTPMGMAEMALLHHFSTSTCFTVSRNPVLQTVWQIRIPQVSFSSPFVFRAIIALSALHLAHIKPEFHDYYVSQAELHHNTALQMVSAILPDINKENCQSIYVFSVLTCFISCAKPRIRRGFWANSDRDIEWLTLFRGTVHILASADDSLRTGPLAPMFEMGRRRKLARDARSTIATPPFLLVLKKLLQDTVQDPSELQCYHDSTDDLAMSFATVDELGSHNCETADIFIWLLTVSDQYFGYFQQRKPEAMVIFAYFCVVMKEMEWAWWMQGLSAHTISGIYYLLDEEHRCWLQWPMQQPFLYTSPSFLCYGWENGPLSMLGQACHKILRPAFNEKKFAFLCLRIDTVQVSSSISLRTIATPRITRRLTRLRN